MRLRVLLAHMPTFEVLAGDPHVTEVSRVEELDEETCPLPGTLYLVEHGWMFPAWIEAHQHSNLFRHLAFVLPDQAEIRSLPVLKPNVVVLRHAEPRLPLDLSARILRIFYEEHRPLQIDTQQLRREIIEETLRGGFRSLNAPLARASVLELALEHKRQVLLADLENPDTFYLEQLVMGEEHISLVRNKLLSLVRGVLFKDSPHHVVSLHGTGVVVLLDQRGVADPALIAKSISETLRRQLGEVALFVVLGNPHPSPGGLAQSYREAQAALEVCRVYGLKAPWISFESLRPKIFLHVLKQNTEVAGLAEAALGPLRTVEPSYRRALLETLVAYLESNRSVYRASKALGIHPNTLKYRMRRLVELLDFQNVDDERKLLYHIAAKLALLKSRLSS